MSPRNAIIIVAILFIMVALLFVFLYLNKQLADNGENLNNQPAVNQDNSTGEQNQSIKPAEIIERKVQKIIEQAEQNPEQAKPEEVRQNIVDAINSEVIKQEQAKTQEQKTADLEAAEERQSIIDQINSQIKQNNQQ